MNEDKILEKLSVIERNTLLASKSIYTSTEAALITGLSKTYLYALVRQREIPYFKPNGRLIYFDKKDLEDWLRRGRISSRAEIEESSSNHLVNGRK